VRALVDFLEARREAFIADLGGLVGIDCGTTNKAGVDAVGEIMRGHLERTGFAVEVLPVERFGDCLVGRVRGTGTARIVLLGHLDTVYPDGTVAERPMTIRDGRVLGPGTNDMKAGLLAGAYAVDALHSAGFGDFAEIAFFCNSEEEVGSPVSRDLYADVVRAADACLVLEGGRADGSIVSARKAGGRYRLHVTGRSAHAGVEPEKGANAVHELAHRIVAIQALGGMRPGTTVSVGVVRGGTRANVVPDAAEAEVDVRIAAAGDIPDVDAAIRAAAAATVVPGTSVEVRGGIGMWPMERTPAVARLVDLARGVARELGIDLRDVATGGLSDANRAARWGTPVLDGLGPVGGLDHSPDEYVELDSIVPRTALLAGLIAAIARDADLRALRGDTVAT
jgi:glutamate carboxypeptidase